MCMKNEMYIMGLRNFRWRQRCFPRDNSSFGPSRRSVYLRLALSRPLALSAVPLNFFSCVPSFCKTEISPIDGMQTFVV